MKFLVLPLSTNNQSAPGVVSGHGYGLVAAHSGKALGLNGNYVVARPWDRGFGLQFRLEALGGDAIGYFRIVHLATGKVLDIEGASKGNGARALLWDWHGGHNKQFQLKPVAGTGKVIIIARHSGQALDISGASTADGAQLLQWPQHGSTDPQWTVAAAFDAPARTFTLAAVHSGLVATDVNGQVQLKQKRWGEDPRQQWRVEPLDGERAGLSRIVNVGSGKVLDIEGDSRDNGARVLLWDWHGGHNQQFYAIDRGNGRITFAARSSGKTLNVQGASKDDGANVLQWPWHGGENQQWQISVVRQTSDLSGLRAAVFEHANYQGRTQELGPGFWNMSDISLANDTISSLRIPAGLRVTLYEHVNFGGAKRTYDADVSFTSDFNDKASSILIELVATIFEHANYGGASQKLGVGRYNIKDLKIGNDRLSSLKVPPGLMVTVYEHADFKGRSFTYIEDSSWVGAINDIASSILVEQIGVVIPHDVVRYGSTINLKSHHGKFLVAEQNGDLLANRAAAAAWETFTLIRSGTTKYSNYVAFGDIVSLKSAHGKYVVAEQNGDSNANRDAIGPWERFVVVRAGAETKHNDFVTQGDLISLRSLAHNKYLVAEQNGDTNVNRAAIGDWERWRVEGVKAPAGSGGGGGGGACGAAACGAEACAADACGAAACGAAAVLVGACGAAASGVAVCGADVCGAAACGAAAAGVAVCGADACGAAACGAAATGVGGTLVGACGAAAGGITACPVNVCGANACGINACPADACGADACGINIMPIIPGI